MPTTKQSNAKVNRGAITDHKKANDQVTILAAACAKGATCTAVTGSTVANAALVNLTTAATNARTSLVSHSALLLSYKTSCKTVADSLTTLGRAATTYMNAVEDVAAGDATVITDAGLTAREGQAKVLDAAVPANLHGEPGKASMEAIVGWDEAAGAGAYKLRVNFTPADPTKWVELPSGTKRRRTITAPTPAAQFLVAVAAIGSEDASDWSDPVMVTAR